MERHIAVVSKQLQGYGTPKNVECQQQGDKCKGDVGCQHIRQDAVAASDMHGQQGRLLAKLLTAAEQQKRD